MAEQVERAHRKRALLSAVVRVQGTALATRCIVRNISSTGARLDLPSSYALPPEFELEIPKLGSTFRCHLVWWSDGAAGVKFETPPATETPDSLEEAKARIEALEKENAALKLEIGRLTAMLFNG